MNVTIGGIARTVEITSFDKLGDVKVCMLTTTADGSVGFQQLNQEVIDTIYASFPVDTAKGDIASFEDGADDVPVRKLTLNLVPYQGGSGDPSPNNVRPIYPANGKNLLENTASSLTTNGITFTVNADGTVSAKGTATADAGLNIPIDTSVLYGDYYFVGAYGQVDSTANVYMWDTTASARCKQWDGTTNVVNSYDGSLKQVKLVQGHTTRMVLRVMNGKTVDMTFYPMICHAEIADSTYVPYNAIGITRTGKNLLGTYDTYSYAAPTVTKNADGSLTFVGSKTGDGAVTLADMPMKKGTYTMGRGNGTAALYFQIRHADTNVSIATTYNSDATFTLDEDEVIRFRVFIKGGVTFNNTIYPQVEVGSVATQYEPYQGERYYPISDNPVYGGTLDVTTGVLTVTHGLLSMDGVTSNRKWGGKSSNVTLNEYYMTWSAISAHGFGVGHDFTDAEMQEAGFMCSSAPIANINNDRKDMYGARVSTGTSGYGQVRIRFPLDDAINTLELAQTWLQNQSANGTPVQFVYELATPQTYQLTPVQVKTLLGYNNIWTDSGTVEVQYLANIGLYIQKIIGVTEDDMVANQNIAANQYFFVGEELYYSTSAISAGQTIIVGTNCIKTNLADALNALNS